MQKIKEIEEIDKDKIEELLESLAKDRPIFHNEQDFQFELARKISENVDSNSNIIIRLEYFIGESSKDVSEQKDSKKTKRNRIYVDIMIIDNNKNEAIAIELKYKAKKFEFEYKNEWYSLKEQGARDFGCYYTFCDLKRIEKIVSNKENKEFCNLKNIDIIRGYVIFLTNDGHSYMEKTNPMTGIFKNYSLNENEDHKIIIKGEEPYEYWNKKDGKTIDYNKKVEEEYTSIKGKPPITFNKEHLGEWSKYSRIRKEEIKKLKDEIVYKLIFEVTSKNN